ncbi:MAG TPA: restriction endonuclease [Opitutaceae bacterium]
MDASNSPTELIVDKIYEGGRAGHAGDDPLSKLLGVSNSGGFRYLGRPDDLRLVVITSNFNEPDWPDEIDLEAGLLTYFGDRREPGALHETHRLGNEVLRQIFHNLHSQPPARNRIPPILLFRNTGNYRDVVFLGLVVPGAAHLPATSDLVAVWKSSRRGRFQNYKAQSTLLRVSSVPLAWIADVRSGNPLSPSCPPEWRTWRETGRYIPLKCEPTIHTRSKAEQLPKSGGDTAILRALFQRYQNDSHGFEHFAAKLLPLMDPNFVALDVTRPSRDGGRDAVGHYRLGLDTSHILIDCALEAKCYNPGKSVGVKELSRLISRLRHRQFGVIVTTSFVHDQAYKEIKDDEHPIIVIAGADIVQILKAKGQTDPLSPVFATETRSTFAP